MHSEWIRYLAFGGRDRLGVLGRYVVFELIKLLAAALTVFALLLTVGMAAKEAVRHNLPISVVLATLPFFLLQMLGFALPAATLFAVCGVYGRLTSSNELIAMKSAGINPLRIVMPAFVVAYLLSLLTVLTFDFAAVWGRPGIQSLILSSADDIAEGILRASGSANLGGGTISVRGVSGNNLMQPCIQRHARDGQPPLRVTAKRGTLSSDGRRIRVVLHDAEQFDGKLAWTHPGELCLEFDLENLGRPLNRDWLSTAEIRMHLTRMRQRYAALQTELPARQQGDCTTSNEPSCELEAERDKLQYKMARFAAEPHRRWANGFSCLAFACLGIPIAMRTHSSDLLTTFFASFLPVLVLFYPMLMISENLATSGAWPPWLFWLGDVLLILVGSTMLRRVLR